MSNRPQKARSARRMPVAPLWNPEGGVLTKPRLWSIWCRLRGHYFLLLTDREEAQHNEFHSIVLSVCLRCGWTDEECLNCDWEDWEDWG